MRRFILLCLVLGSMTVVVGAGPPSHNSPPVTLPKFSWPPDAPGSELGNHRYVPDEFRGRAALPSPRMSPSEDDLWSSPFGLPSADGSIYCGVYFGNDLIVGGTFGQIGGVVARNIARWDGTAWHPLGNGTDDEVSALAVYHGELIVGGRFQYVDGQFSPYIAKWSGASWSSVEGFAGSPYCCYGIRSLVVHGDELIAGGEFGPNEPEAIRGIRRWNGSQWSSLGDGIDGTVQTMLPVGDLLYVAGTFDTAGDVPATDIASWDGTTWRPLGTGVGHRGWWGVRSLAEFQGNLYAGGDFDSIGGEYCPGLASWDGTAWSSVEGFESGYVFAMAVRDGSLEIARYPGMVRWDGTSWSAGATGVVGEAHFLIVNGSEMVAGGSFYIGDPGGWNVSAFKVARWNGESWSSFEPWGESRKGLASFAGSSAHVHGLATYEGKLVAAGLIDYAGTGSGWERVQPVVTWDGGVWSSVGFGVNGIPTGVFPIDELMYVTGLFAMFGFGEPFFPVMRWDGATWSYLPSLSLTGQCLVRHDGTLFIGTERRAPYETAEPGVYRYNMDGWESVGLTGSSQGVLSLVAHQGKLVAGGRFTHIDGVAARGVAAWDGAAWQEVGDPNTHPTYVMKLLSDGDRLIAAGDFSTPMGRVPLMVWDGIVWTAVPGISGYGYDVALIQGKLFLGGYLTLTGSSDVARIAMWDGQRWHSMGSGTNGPPRTIVEHKGDVYVGGQLSLAGGKSSFGVARWDGLNPPSVPSPPPTTWLSRGRPNPFSTTSDFAYQIARGGHVRLTIHDAQGREVKVLEEGDRSTRIYQVRWDGRDGHGKKLPAGMYFLSVREASGTVITRKVILLR